MSKSSMDIGYWNERLAHGSQAVYDVVSRTSWETGGMSLVE